MLFGIGTLLLFVLIFGPQQWTRHILKHYGNNIEGIPGSGGELAVHLLEKLEIKDVSVVKTKSGNDHYDPGEKVIRLSPNIYDGKSLTAVTIAAHECGHAMQHHTGYTPMYLRWHMFRFLAWAEKIGVIVLVSTPIIALVTHSSHLGIATLVCGIFFLFMPVLFHLLTLPVELDASFGRALPILKDGGYLSESDIPKAKKILIAAALTYLSVSLASILNLYRWLIFLRR